MIRYDLDNRGIFYCWQNEKILISFINLNFFQLVTAKIICLKALKILLYKILSFKFIDSLIISYRNERVFGLISCDESMKHFNEKEEEVLLLNLLDNVKFVCFYF